MRKPALWTLTASELIKEKSILDIKTGCFNWSGYKRHGYGILRKEKISVHIASRWVYFLCYPNADKNLNVCHHCDNRACINPEHLYAATQKKNIQDAFARGRMPMHGPKGERHGLSKIKASYLPDIRKRLKRGEFCKSIGKLYGVCETTITCIKLGKTWTHIK